MEKIDKDYKQQNYWKVKLNFSNLFNRDIASLTISGVNIRFNMRSELC